MKNDHDPSGDRHPVRHWMTVISWNIGMLVIPILLVSCKTLDLSMPYEDAESVVSSPATWISAGQGCTCSENEPGRYHQNHLQSV